MEKTLNSPTWIWYPGDYEIWLGNDMNNRRTDRGAYFPPFWKQDSHYVTVEFSKEVTLQQAEVVNMAVEGSYNVKIDGKMLFGMPQQIRLEAGRHKINIKVHNQTTPPALFMSGATVNTDASWNVTFEDKEWIDESGKASDTSATMYMKAGCWNFNTGSQLPSQFRLALKPQRAVCGVNGVYDFGRETFGYVQLHGLKGNGSVYIYYGESQEEANDSDHCETYDMLTVADGMVTNMINNEVQPLTDVYTLQGSRAFRYVRVAQSEGMQFANVTMLYEYMPLEHKGSFSCSDDELNRIWQIAAYTMDVTTREFFIDGIKRDRWVWSGDAAQSYLMNYYLANDNDEVKRTIWLLGGKAPITSHINTIMDYTFFWFISIYDYYMFSGDEHFMHQIYPTMVTYMDYVLGRTDSDGMVQGLTGDWVFCDWADRPMSKQGQLAFEQILFLRSLQAISYVAMLVGDEEASASYDLRARQLQEKLMPCFWDEQQQVLVHNRVDGQQQSEVFRYPNMFAIMYGYLDAEKRDAVKRHVMLNPDVLSITTPYMRFYELEALCMMGEHEQVMREMKAYWGGMLQEGATTFWEKYNPEEQGAQRYAMYGRPYGKSLCHAWGASPIYLLGRYYLGVQPLAPGYAEYEVRPHLGGLQWMQGTVPTPFGQIEVSVKDGIVTVKSTGGHGTLIVGDRRLDIPAGQETSLKVEK